MGAHRAPYSPVLSLVSLFVSLVASELSRVSNLGRWNIDQQNTSRGLLGTYTLHGASWDTRFQNPASVLCESPSSYVEREEVPEAAPAGRPVSTRPQPQRQGHLQVLASSVPRVPTPLECIPSFQLHLFLVVQMTVIGITAFAMLQGAQITALLCVTETLGSCESTGFIPAPSPHNH